jgi:hypothetical protein
VGVTEGVIPKATAVWEQLQTLQGRIRIARREIEKYERSLGEGFPEGISTSFVEHINQWKGELKEAEDRWWELNYPKLEERTKARINQGLQKLNRRPDLLGFDPSDRTSDQTAPPTLFNLYQDHSLVRQAVSAARSTPPNSKEGRATFAPVADAGFGRSPVKPPAVVPERPPRTPISQRLALPLNRTGEARSSSASVGGSGGDFIPIEEPHRTTRKGRRRRPHRSGLNLGLNPREVCDEAVGEEGGKRKVSTPPATGNGQLRISVDLPAPEYKKPRREESERATTAPPDKTPSVSEPPKIVTEGGQEKVEAQKASDPNPEQAAEGKSRGTGIYYLISCC